MSQPYKQAFEEWASPIYYECKICNNKKFRHHHNHHQHLKTAHKTSVKDHCDMHNIKRLMHTCVICKQDEEKKFGVGRGQPMQIVHCKQNLFQHFAAKHHPQISLYEYYVQYIMNQKEDNTDDTEK